MSRALADRIILEAFPHDHITPAQRESIERVIGEHDALVESLKTESGRAAFALANGYPLPEEVLALRRRIEELEAEAGDLSLQHLQANQPWTIPYSSEFNHSNEMPGRQGHRNLSHDLMHVMKSLGKIAAICEQGDHDRALPYEGRTVEALAGEVADLVICALHIATTNPLGTFDLGAVVVEKMESRNGVKLR